MIQKTQPSFTGKIVSLKRIDIANREAGFQAIKPDELKTLRPLIIFLKHNCEGNHSILIQENPDVVQLHSEFIPKDKSANSFVRGYSMIGCKLGKSAIDTLLQYSNETSMKFKGLRIKEKIKLVDAQKEAKAEPKQEPFWKKIFLR